MDKVYKQRSNPNKRDFQHLAKVVWVYNQGASFSTVVSDVPYPVAKKFVRDNAGNLNYKYGKLLCVSMLDKKYKG